MLGADTGSNSLREWARRELNGYGDEDEVPAYRHIPVPVIRMSSISGFTVVNNQRISRFELPSAAIEGVPEELHLREAVEELESYLAMPTLAFTHNSLVYAQMVWNEELDEYQQVTGLHFETTTSAIAGILGRIRTQLFDVVADLTSTTPMSELPRKDQVDAAVGQHIGTQYITTIHAANGPTAIGSGAEAKAKRLSIEDALKLLDAVREASSEVDESHELIEAVEDLRREVASAAPDTGAVIRKAGRLKSVAAKIGNGALIAATGGAVEAFTGLALSGVFS